MPYLGSKPTERVLEADDIASNAVTTAKIANDAVDRDKVNLVSTSGAPSLEAKGDGSSQDGYIQLNCSQNSHGIKLKSPPHSAAQSYTLTFPSSVTNDYFLKTDGSGNLSFAEPGGGAYNFISDTNCTGASDFEINDLSSTYDNYFLLMTGVKNNNTVSHLRTTVGTSGSYASSGYYWSRWGVGIGNGGSAATVSQNGNYFEFSSQGPTNSIRNYQMHIHRKSNGGTRCTFFGFNMGQENATWDESHYTFGGFIDTGSLIDDIKFEMLTNTGQITITSARLYGIANS